MNTSSQQCCLRTKAKASDGHASRCVHLSSAVDLWRYVIAGRAVQYEEAMKYLVAIMALLGLAVFVIYQDVQFLMGQR